MKEIGLENPDMDKITEYWSLSDERKAKGKSRSTLYSGQLNKKRWNLKWNLKVKIYNEPAVQRSFIEDSGYLDSILNIVVVTYFNQAF